MKHFIIVTLTFFTATILNGQCDFPRNNGTNQYQNAIVYSGKIYRADLPNGRVVFSIDPSKLGFKTHDLTGDTLPYSAEGQWLFRWHYAASPNRWQPLPFDCETTSVSLQNAQGDPIRTGFIECDFFYLDYAVSTSATFMGSVTKNIAFNFSGNGGDKVSAWDKPE